MLRCPQCGQDMYPEEDSLSSEAEPAASGWIANAGGVLIGWMVAAGIALLVHFIISAFVPPGLLRWPTQAILYVSGPVGTFVGGYICGVIAKQHTRWLGGLIGVLSLPVVVLLSTYWVHVSLSVLFSPWMVLLGVLTILGGVAGGWLCATLSQGGDWKERWRVKGWEDLLYQDLLRKVRFNGAAADRLIEFERKQNPEATRLQLLQSAIERWEKDNR
jgi:hypothetical protein